MISIKKYLILIICFVYSLKAGYCQGIDLVSRVSLVITVTGYANEKSVSDTTVSGILTSIPAGSIIEVEGNVILADTVGLTHLIIKFGTQKENANLTERVIDYSKAINGEEDGVIVEGGYNIRINFGQMSKPDYLWLGVKSRNMHGYFSDEVKDEIF